MPASAATIDGVIASGLPVVRAASIIIACGAWSNGTKISGAGRSSISEWRTSPTNADDGAPGRGVAAAEPDPAAERIAIAEGQADQRAVDDRDQRGRLRSRESKVRSRAPSAEPCRLELSDLDRDVVLAFLDHVDRERGNGSRTRNARLTTIRSFFRHVAANDPAALGIAQRVLDIPSKRTILKAPRDLSIAHVDALLDAPERHSPRGTVTTRSCYSWLARARASLKPSASMRRTCVSRVHPRSYFGGKVARNDCCPWRLIWFELSRRSVNSVASDATTANRFSSVQTVDGLPDSA
jgi:hypothetical protein